MISLGNGVYMRPNGTTVTRRELDAEFGHVPEAVNVLGVTYDVVRASLDGADGEIDPRRQRITLDSRLSGAKLEQTFLHELVHGILAQLGCQDEYEDERLVQGLAIGLHQALWAASPSS